MKSSPLLSLQTRAQNCCNSLANVGVRERKDFGCCGSSLPCGKGSTFKDMGQADSEQDRSAAAGCTGL